MRSSTFLALAVLATIGTDAAALASETITYVYDARGRVVQVARSGTINNGVTTVYTIDKANNRTNKSVSGAPPAAPSFSVNDALATEGAPLVFTITKTGSTTSSFDVSYASANDTAVGGSDYTAASGTLTFSPAQSSQTISVATVDDTAVESAETMVFNLSAATGGATISDAQGQGTITDNDSAGSVSFSVNDAPATEGGSLVFTVTKTGSSTGSLSVNYASANDTAVAGSDYTASSGTLTFTSAQSSQTVTVATTDDAVVETTEAMVLNLSSATGGATISDAQGVGTISDNDVESGVSFAISDAETTEGDFLVFTVTKTGSTASSFTVNYATASGTAAAGDYTPTSGTLTFTSSQTSRTINVATATDNRPGESDETVFVNLSGASTGSTISDNQGVGTIINDPCPDPNTC